ncbi:MAG: CPBP family intramembrane glutamic endopeptidase [Verrucomicrobiota bacterium]
MRKVMIGFLGFLFGAVILAAVFSPALFWISETLWRGVFPFHRIFNRSLMIAALILIFPLTRYWGIDSWKKIGIQETDWRKKWLRGFGWGCAMIFLLMAFEVVFGHRALSGKIGWLKTGEIILTAISVGFCEELLFRGLFFYAIREYLKKWLFLWAIFLSAFFATMHFLKAKGDFATVTWQSGWEMLGNLFPSAIIPIVPRWMSLFLVGLILCAVVWRWKSLWLAIGLHTGWVLLLQFSYRISSPRPTTFWFGQDMISGGFAMVILILILIIFCVPLRKKNENVV